MNKRIHYFKVSITNMLLVFVCFLLMTNNNVSAQTASPTMSSQEAKAQKYFNEYRYLQAIAAYTPIVEKDSNNINALKNLATSYRKVNDFANAENVYAKIISLDTITAENYLYYAQSLSTNKKYTEAGIAYEKYASLKSNDNRGTAFKAAYGNLPNFYKDSSSMSIELLNINSGQSDFSPVYYQKGLVFCSNRNEGQIVKRVFEWNESAFLDLYYLKDTADLKIAKEATATSIDYQKRKQQTNDDDTYPTSNDSRTTAYMSYNYKDTSGMFTHPEVHIERFSKTLSTKYHEGPLAFFSNQDSLIFTRNNFYNGKYKEGTDGVNKLKLYSATLKNSDSSWKNVKSLSFNNDNYSTGHPAIAPGDSILYFVSDMPGGFGGTDIYKSYYRNGDWSVPENLGTPINTEGNEMFPFIDKQNNLYFASDGHPGLGGLDIFTTSLNNIGTIRNIGYPANSSYDDFGIIMNPLDNTGFFSSNRRRGSSDDDIYRIKIQNTFYIKVIDGITKELISLSEIKVKEVPSNQHPVIDSSQTGKFKVGLSNNSYYEIIGAAKGYATDTLIAMADASNPIITVPLYKPGCIVAGTIRDKDTKKPVNGAHIVIIDMTTHDTVYTFTVDTTGKYRYPGLVSNHQYSLDVSREGYFNKPADQLSTANNKCISTVEREYDYLRDFELEKIVVGRAIKIDNIYFDLAKYNIRPSAAKELDKIVKLMQENPDIIIELSSHTDCRASYQYNMTLSDNRAKASAGYIVSKGISAQRITGKGYGETKLVNDCACEGKVVSRTCTEAEHQANRRTEFQVTGFLSDKNASIENDGKGNVPSSIPAEK